jgi:hypothetical protein
MRRIGEEVVECQLRKRRLQMHNSAPLAKRRCDTAGLMHGAIVSGNLDTIVWLAGKGCSWGDEEAQLAARSGQLDVLKWFQREWLSEFAADILGICVAAAEGGHLHVLQHAMPTGCCLFHTADICAAAAAGGQGCAPPPQRKEAWANSKDPNPGCCSARNCSQPRKEGWNIATGEGSKGRGGKEMFRGVVELRLGEKCARVGCAFYGDFFYATCFATFDF